MRMAFALDNERSDDGRNEVLPDLHDARSTDDQLKIRNSVQSELGLNCSQKRFLSQTFSCPQPDELNEVAGVIVDHHQSRGCVTDHFDELRRRHCGIVQKGDQIEKRLRRNVGNFSNRSHCQRHGNQ